MSLLRNSSIYTIGNLIPAIVGFLLLPVYTHYLSPSDYAVLASMEVLAYLYGVFVNFNLERAAYRFYFDKDDQKWKNDLFFTIQYASIIIALVWLLVALLLQNILVLAFPSIHFWPIYILVLGRITAEVLLRTPMQYYRVTEKPVSFVVISLIRFVVNISLVLWFLIIREDGVEGVLTANLLAAISMIPIAVYIGKKKFKGKFRKTILIDALKFSWPFIPTLIVAWIINLSDRIFLEYYSNQFQLGIYGMAYSIASAYLIIMKSYHSAYLPRYFKYANMDDQSLATKILAKDSETNIVIHIIVCFLMILWTYEIVYYFLSSEYAEVVLIMRILLVSHLFATIPIISFSAALLQKKMTKTNMYTAIISALINLVLNFLLIPDYGMYGAVIATVLSMISLFVIQYYVSKLAYSVKFPWRIFFMSILIGFLILSMFILLLEEMRLISLILKGLVSLFLLIKTYNFYKLTMNY